MCFHPLDASNSVCQATLHFSATAFQIQAFRERDGYLHKSARPRRPLSGFHHHNLSPLGEDIRSGALMSALGRGSHRLQMLRARRDPHQKTFTISDASPASSQEPEITQTILNRTVSAGEHVRGEIHIQTANSRHERLKSFLRKHRGVATRYLDSYLRWYKLTILPKTPSARSVLATALELIPAAQPQRIANAN